MLSKAFISLFLFLLLFVNVFTQEIVFRENFPITFSEIKYEKNPDSKQKINNTIISEIAVTEPKSLSSVSFPIVYNLSISISKSAYQNYSLDLRAKDIEIKREIIINDFNISEIIYPSKADIVILLSGLKNENNLKISFEDINIKDKSITISEEIPGSDVGNGTQLTAKLENLKFYFDELDEKLIESRLVTIFDFLATEMIIDSTIKKIESIDVENTPITPDVFLKIKESNRIVKIISKKDFSELSHNECNQHYNFEERLDVLERKALRMNTIFQQNLNKTQEIEIEEQYTALIDKYVDLFTIYHDESSRVPHTFSSSVINLAKIDSDNSSIFLLVDVINDLINHSNLKYLQFDYDIISASIVAGMIRKAAQYIELERHNEALDVLNNANSICKIVPGDYNFDELHSNTSRAKYGIYQSYIKVSERAVKGNNFQLAEKYLDQAINFQIENSEYIISAIPTEKTVSEFVINCIKTGELALLNNNYTSALISFDYASKYLNMVSTEDLNLRLQNGIIKAENGLYEENIVRAEELIHNDELIKAKIIVENLISKDKKNKPFKKKDRKLRDLKKKVENKNVTSLYLKAKESYFSGLYNDAYNKLVEIKELNLKMSDYQTSEIENFSEQVLKLIIKNNVDNGISKAWQNDFESANEILTNSEKLLEESNLQDDKKIAESLSNLKERIVFNECIIVKDKYDVLITKSKRLIKNQSFREAIKCLGNAIEIINQNNKCTFSDTSAFELYRWYYHAAVYQENLEKLSTNLYSRGFRNSIEQYISLENYYFKFGLDTTEIRHNTFYDFILSQNSPEMTIFSFNYFIKQNNPDEAMKMLDVLEKCKYPSLKTKDLLIDLGKILAEKDFANMPEAEPNDIVMKYYKDNSNFKTLRREYLRTWKRLYAIDNY